MTYETDPNNPDALFVHGRMVCIPHTRDFIQILDAGNEYEEWRCMRKDLFEDLKSVGTLSDVLDLMWAERNAGREEGVAEGERMLKAKFRALMECAPR